MATATSVDSQVQHTNDDSIVSKRSAGKLGYVTDDFLRHFVKKLSRRAPLINRGYYLRIHAMSDLLVKTIQHLLETYYPSVVASAATSVPTLAPKDAKIQVLSLGAGFDTFAARYASVFSSVSFFEVDFPDVIRNKVHLMAAAGLSKSFPQLLNATADLEIGEVHGSQYHSIGLDLRLAESSLLQVLSSHGFDRNLPTIVYAECVMQYMSIECSDGIIRFVAQNLPQSVFYAYDQAYPADSFGRVMMGSLKSRCSPLLGIDTLTGGMRLAQRAQRCGLAHDTRLANFFDVSGYYLSGDELKRVADIEAFDEDEEWSEMCDHYVILGASNTPAALPPLPYLKPIGCNHNDSAPRGQNECSDDGAVLIEVDAWPLGRCDVDGWGSEVVCEMEQDEAPVFITFGGYQVKKGQARTEAVVVHSMRHGDLKVISIVSNSNREAQQQLVVPPTCGHSFTRIARHKYLAFGGRTNPHAALDCLHLCSLDFSVGNNTCVAKWSRVDGSGAAVPIARYRHLALYLPLFHAVLVYGGRDSARNILSDAWLLHLDDKEESPQRGRWSRLTTQNASNTEGKFLGPLCSSAGAIVGSTDTKISVLISGGMDTDSSCSGAFCLLTLEKHASGDISAEVERSKHFSMSPRYSHSMTGIGHQSVLILGGASFQPKRADEANQPSILVDLNRLKSGNAVTSAHSCSPVVLRSAGFAEPTMARHAAFEISPGTVAVIGGGFTCFSFGNHALKPMVLRFPGVEKLPVAVPCLPQAPVVASVCAGTSVAFSAAAWGGCSRQVPCVFTNVPLGICLRRWGDMSYLTEKQGGTMVLVHAAPNTHYLDFIQKNFTFKKVAFSELIAHCFKSTPDEEKELGETWYLRSVALSSSRDDVASFYRDFPHLAVDFSLPTEMLQVVGPRMQQSVLRVNQKGMQLWTHYDTLDNILCQVVGRKKVVVFPPDQYSNLYMSGSSSRVVNIDNPDLAQYPKFATAKKHQIEFVLHPGDVLVIPALWLHHVTALDACISINIFYRTLPDETYDSKDMYGNKDLPISVAARAEVVACAKRLVVGRLPAPHDEFTLRQIMDELAEMADALAVQRKHNS